MKKTVVGLWMILACFWCFPLSLKAQEGLKVPLAKVVLQLKWKHQFQFAGFYAAKARGFYEKAGLNVEIRPGGFDIHTIDRVVNGQAEFGVTNSEILVARLRDKKPVVVLAPVFQHSPLVFITRQQTGITHPQEFVGKRIKMTRQLRDLELHATFFNEGIPLDQILIVDGPLKKAHLFDPEIDAAAVYVTNEPYFYLEKQIPYQIIRPGSYGVDFYGDTIFTSQKMIDQYPERVTAFLEASLQGWQYAMDHKKEIISLILEEYRSDKTRVHLEYEADSMDDLVLSNLVALGHNNPGRWAHIADIFVRHGIISEDYSLAGMFFDPFAKKHDSLRWEVIGALGCVVLFFLTVIAALYIFNQRLNREIRQKNESREALVQSETRFKSMFENIYSGVSIYAAVDSGNSFTVKSMNRRIQQMRGIRSTDIQGKPAVEVFPEIVASGLLDVMKRVYQTGNPEHLPTRRYEEKQVAEWYENYVYKLPSGEVAVVCNDETVRKRAEVNRKHLDTINHIIINTRHTDTMLESILDAVFDIFECDRCLLLYPCDPLAESVEIKMQRTRPGVPEIEASRLTFPVTPRAARFFKKLMEENRPKVFYRAEMSPDQQEIAERYQIRSAIWTALFPKIDQAWMLCIHRCRSKTAWTSEDQVLFNNIGRRISDGLNASLLILELQKINQTLRESEDRFEKIFHSSPVGLLIAEKQNGRIINVNQSFLETTGYPEQKLLGADVFRENFLFSDESLQLFQKNRDKEFFSHFEIAFFDQQARALEGHLSCQTVTISGNDCMVLVIEDITGYNQAHREKEAAIKHAAEQEKHALIGQVAGKMAHDFNNILGAIMGNTELSLMECKDPSLRQTLELILDQTKRGRNLTRNLVVFAKDQEPRQDYFDLNEKITLVLNLLKKDLEGVRVITYLAEDMPELLADPGMIENALVNIIHNAVHAMSKTPDPHLLIHTGSDHVNLQVEIVDNGCGIPEEHHESVYAPAFTLKNDKLSDVYDASIKGTGYGLFNVKKIVEKHKGTIQFESGKNEGTRFSISFPVIRRDLTQEEKAEIERTEPLTGKRILIVEDEPSIFEVQQMILGSAPFFHHVDVAQNGKMALDHLAQHQYDLISLDYLLPGRTSGMDLYQIIRENDVRVPILFISGNIEFIESIISMTQQDHFLDHLSKPCQNRIYVETINSLLERAAS